MHSVLHVLPSTFVLGATDFWLTKWVTPLWLLGLGIGAGLVLLAIGVLLLKALSVIPVFKFLENNRPAAHIVALIVSVALAATIYTSGCPLFANAEQIRADMAGDGSAISQALRPNQEQLMFGLALLLLSTVLGWGLIFGSMPKNATELYRSLTDGVASYLLVLCGFWIAIALGGTFLVDEPNNTLSSIPKLFSNGKMTFTKKLEPATAEELKGVPNLKQMDLDFDPSLIYRVEIGSDRAILLTDAATADKFEMSPRKIDAGEISLWQRGQAEAPPIPLSAGSAVFAANLEQDAAEVKFTLYSAPKVPEAMMIVIAAITVFFFGFGLIAQNAVAPRLSAVALATAKSELAQPLFLVLLLIGTVAIVIFVFLPFYTFGEDTKSLKECGITVILVLAIFQGVWAASGSVSDEIEGRTALTVLSKPIQRRSFVLGKFLGIFWVLLLMFAILGSFQLIAIGYKPLFEARETSENSPMWQGCFQEVSRTVPGLFMALMQATILTAISVAVSTRLPQLANFAVCFGIYLVGNLTPTLVGSSDQQFEIVRFVAQLIAVVIPILDHFSMQAAIDANNAIPFSLLCGNLVYTGLYVALAMFVALLFFEERDLA
jgi:hypothetical protein